MARELRLATTGRTGTVKDQIPDPADLTAALRANGRHTKPLVNDALRAAMTPSSITDAPSDDPNGAAPAPPDLGKALAARKEQ